MKLQLNARQAQKKSEAKALRRSGQIPAVIYSEGKEGQAVAVSEHDFTTALDHVKSGHLPTTVFELTGEAGNVRKAVVREIQYHPTTYRVLHIDFEQLKEDVDITVKVPIEFTGVADCAGIKLGGVLRQVIRHLKVRCKPKKMPSAFQLDVTNLKMKQSLRLSDIAIPTDVKPLGNLNEVAVVIAKR
ncbi:MAG: 50S ribosomal protein L25/general stress protein Ctc [Chlamydiia bacterium]|nr:50S ribosomal protein L25/general stress protein Ctc [Chlamydiia bacterium]